MKAKSIGTLASEKGMTKQEYAKWYFLEQGCELLEEYEHTMKKMKYRCRCGREAEVCWNKFTLRNRRCGYCGSNGRKIPYSLEEALEVFRSLGCELLDDAFMGVHHLVRYRCSCGNESKIRMSDLQRGYRCKKCGIAKQSGEKHWAWVEDREELRRRQLFRKKCYKALASTLAATGQEKVGHTSDWIGYGPKELQEHIEAHPNWNKVKNKRWHLDHIFPIQAFLDYGITDLRVINALDNLQPITQRENNIKKDKYDKQVFKEWLLTKGVVTV
jgi:hypothetical protein